MSAGPFLFGYDGSDFARGAIERSAALLERGPAVALTVWESALAFVYRRELPESFEVARDVVDEVDAGTRRAAEQTAAEGAELIRAQGFEVEPLARRAVDDARRETTAVWQEVVRAGDDLDARAVVLASRGRSGLRSAVLGSVSHGVLAHSRRPVLIVPALHADD